MVVFWDGGVVFVVGGCDGGEYIFGVPFSETLSWSPEASLRVGIAGSPCS